MGNKCETIRINILKNIKKKLHNFQFSSNKCSKLINKSKFLILVAKLVIEYVLKFLRDILLFQKISSYLVEMQKGNKSYLFVYYKWDAIIFNIYQSVHILIMLVILIPKWCYIQENTKERQQFFFIYF